MNPFFKIATLTGLTCFISPIITIAEPRQSLHHQHHNSHSHFNRGQKNPAHSPTFDRFNSFSEPLNFSTQSESINPKNNDFESNPNNHHNFEIKSTNSRESLNQNEQILNLEVPSQIILENPGLPMMALPQILTGGVQHHATTVRVGENGVIQLTHTERVTSIREVLSEIEVQTNQKPAVIYVMTHPKQFIDRIEGVQLQGQNGLTLMLVLPDGQPIVKSITDVELNKLRQIAKEFYTEINDPRTTGWPAAHQLYQWLIAPLEPDLKAAGIDTLLFYLDEELRSIPLAALYDGKQFLIETYNFSLIPSLNLTNASYEGLQNAEVLAMGMSEFLNQPTLPSIPTEVLTITEKLWPGEALLNQAFTLENLQKKRNQQTFKIIHLATHAHFNPQQNPYIQLWDRKLPLKQLRDLEWYKQPQVELLVLSACETGLGNTLDTEMGFAGLAHQAGVKSALASLWQVSDVGTLGLMIEFYRHLKSSSIKAEALRQAQLALLRGQVDIEPGLLHSTRGDASVSNTLATRLQTEDLSHPYYWAGFTMIGSPW